MGKKIKIKKNYNLAREELRQWIEKWTECSIQGGYIDKKLEEGGWSCGTCFIHLLNEIGLTSDNEAYHERNDDNGRTNEVWRAILQIRDAKIK